MKIIRKKEFMLLVLLLVISIYSYMYVPKSFYIGGGGSCYQGITASITRFIVKCCVVLDFMAILLLFAEKITVSKIINIVSIILWSLCSITTIQVAKGGEIFYFVPMLLLNILILLMIIKSKKSEKIAI